MNLLLVAVGPVQGFIRGSRKSQDLWAASDLISSLSKAAAAELEVRGAKLVFPPSDVVRRDDRPIANKILVELPDTEDADRAGSAAASAARTALADYLEAAQARLRALGVSLVEDLVSRQIACFLEVTWASHTSSEHDYALARRRLEEALDGRKRLRDFAGYRGEPGRLKSSIDGVFESVLEPEAATRLLQRFGEAFVSPGEALDATGIVRRFRRDDADRRRRWKSSSRVAVAPYVTQVRQCTTRGPLLNRVEDAAEELNRAAQQVGLPDRTIDSDLGELLLQPAFAQRQSFARRLGGENPDGTALPGALDAPLRALQARIEDLRAARKEAGAPSPYYAVVSADGDRIGTWMADLATPDDHRRAASYLAAFAGCVIDELGERDDASVIFAGGDDVLALVSLDGALQVVARLATLFHREVADRVEEPLSLSIGVAIVHVRENFHDAIRIARRAERAAKDAGGGRLAMALAKRAGRDLRLVMPLDDVHAGRIEDTVRLLRDRDLPGGLAHEIEVLADQIQDAPPELRSAELRRVFARKRADRGGRPIDEAVLAWLVSRVTRAPDTSGYPSFTEQVQELVSLLLVGAHIASYVQPSTFARGQRGAAT